MGCAGGCGGSKSQAASVPAPYDYKLPDGTTVRVNNKTEEKAARDQCWVRMRASGKPGYTVTR